MFVLRNNIYSIEEAKAVPMEVKTTVFHEKCPLRPSSVDSLNIGFFTRGFCAVTRVKKEIQPSLNYS